MSGWVSVKPMEGLAIPGRNLNTGAWGHFANAGQPGSKGGDLVSLYAALNHINQLPALNAVAAMVGVTEGRAPRTLPRTMPDKPKEKPSEPIPDDPPQPPPHPTLGVATATYRYGRAFWISRYDPPTGKEFCWHTWRNGKWHRQGYSGPRPAYNADLLGGRPDAPVLIVEGEKCADIATQQLRKYVCMTWAGGSNAVKQTDWTCLAGRDVIIWPDADDTGRAAGAQLAEILAPIAARVRVVQPNGQDPGWDIDDAVKEGMGPHEIAKWCAAHITDKITKQSAPARHHGPVPGASVETTDQTVPTPTAAAPAATEPSQEDSGAATAEPASQTLITRAEQPDDDDYPNGQPPRSNIVTWKNLALATDAKDVPHVNVSNASLILRFHEEFKGKIWLDTFRDKIYHTLLGAARPWTDADTRRATAFIQQALNLPKFSSMTVYEAIQHAAECDPHNSVVEWLDSLKWDGISRINTWLTDTLEVEHNEYSMSVARNWLIGMVNRAYDPGCKMDHMPVLEGPQGLRKTTFLETLGGEWYKSLPMKFGEKDFLQAIKGAWLVEIPDMTGFTRGDHSAIISTITIRHDEYRKSYGRETESHPRTTVFSATSERDNYLSDIRGRRRYWPLRCKKIHIDVLVAQRENLFAEAVNLYKRGEMYWEMPESTDEEQRARAEPDPWAEKVIYTAEMHFEASQCDLLRAQITATFLLEKLGVTIDRQTQTERNRISAILDGNGWKNHRTPNARLWYKPAMVKDKSSRFSS
ncbi:VapE domain-containing protein [Bradyrhizobium sp.]